MSIDLSALGTENKLLFNVPLVPVQGHRFQPTGFPDLGAAVFQAKGHDCVLVESPQSMANRLELTIWDTGQNRLIPNVQGLSHVVVNNDKNEFLTDSIIEAHRLNSVYIKVSDKGNFHKELEKEMQYSNKNPVNYRAFLSTLLKYDINALIHGTFLESIGGRLRIARSLSAFIEADNVSIAASGGVKNDQIQPSKEEGKNASDRFGNILFHREEYTAESITAYFNLDLAQIRGYGLGDKVERMLILLALYKIRALLDGNLRLRTACDLEVAIDNIVACRPQGFALSDLQTLAADLQTAIKDCADLMTVTTVTYNK